MRADRLVQLLLFLQQRTKVTVAQVAEELEISPRTARRDLEALAMSGIPVYSQPGRGGGWQLIGGATTDLSGLTEAEARALFLVASGSQGPDPQLQAALRKLTQALPEPFRAPAQVATSSIIVDPEGWGHTTSTADGRPDHFDTISVALLDSRQLELSYVSGKGRASIRVVDPLGLIEKRSRWYLVAGTPKGIRTFRLDRVQGAKQTGEPVVRPVGFDLKAAWDEINRNFSTHSLSVTARGRCRNGAALDALHHRMNRRLKVMEPDTEPGWTRIELASWSAIELARELAGFGGDVDITEPSETVVELARIGREITANYGDRSILPQS